MTNPQNDPNPAIRPKAGFRLGPKKLKIQALFRPRRSTKRRKRGRR